MVKQLFRCTLAIRRSEMGLPETSWFKEPWQMQHDQEEFLLSEHQAKQGVDSTKNILKKLTLHGDWNRTNGNHWIRVHCIAGVTVTVKK